MDSPNLPIIILKNNKKKPQQRIRATAEECIASLHFILKHYKHAVLNTLSQIGMSSYSVVLVSSLVTITVCRMPSRFCSNTIIVLVLLLQGILDLFILQITQKNKTQT